MALASLMATVLRLALVALPAFLVAALRATLVSIATSMGAPLALAPLASLLLEVVGFGPVVPTSLLVSVAAPSLRAAAALTLLTGLGLSLGPLTAILSLSGFATVLEVRLVYRVGFEPAVLLPAALSLPSGLSASPVGLLPELLRPLLSEPLFRFARLTGLPTPLALPFVLSRSRSALSRLLSLLTLSAALSLPFGLSASSLGLLLVVLGLLLGKSLSRFARSAGFLSLLALPSALLGPFVVSLRLLALAPAVVGTLRADVTTATAAKRAVEPAPVVAVLTSIGAAVLLVAVTLLVAASFDVARAVGTSLVSPLSVAVVSVVHG